jgi:hypothetical protein
LADQAVDDITATLEAACNDTGGGWILYWITSSPGDDFANIGDDRVPNYNAKFAIRFEVGLRGAASYVGGI